MIELVKNAYDADATEVKVEFHDDNGQQMIRIQDNGSGMNLSDLHSKWAWLATENKVRASRSTIHRRPLLGQKGVGRFAAEKLGHKLLLRTKTEADEKILHVRFDWDQVEPEKELSDYEWPIKHKKPEHFESKQGTRLDIQELRTSSKRSSVEKLRDQLSRLIDPEMGAADFRIFFLTPWKELNGLLLNPLPGKETHALIIALDEYGNETMEVISPEKKERKTAKLAAPGFGPVKIRLRYFGKGLAKSERGRGGDTDADWNVGIRIFRDGCRVRPYGEPGPDGDWRQIYRTRYLKGSRFRLKPHYLEGTIHITKANNAHLRDTTSREGLGSNEEYFELVEYVKDKVAVLSELVREEKLREERSRLQERYKQALNPLTAGLNQVHSDEYRRAVEDSDKTIKKTQSLDIRIPRQAPV